MTTTTETDWQKESRERAERAQAACDLADATRTLVTGKLFPALRKLGYVALANREYDEVQEAVEKKKAIGYVYWDRQDNGNITPPERRWRGFKFDGMYLSFGGVDKDDAKQESKTRMLGGVIVAQAKLDGLIAEWDGNTNHRVKVSARPEVVDQGRVVAEAERKATHAMTLREEAKRKLTEATNEYEDAKAAHDKLEAEALAARNELARLNAEPAKAAL